jgi:hypothetical protein
VEEVPERLAFTPCGLVLDRADNQPDYQEILGIQRDLKTYQQTIAGNQTRQADMLNTIKDLLEVYEKKREDDRAKLQEIQGKGC